MMQITDSKIFSYCHLIFIFPNISLTRAQLKTFSGLAAVAWLVYGGKYKLMIEGYVLDKYCYLKQQFWLSSLTLWLFTICAMVAID